MTNILTKKLELFGPLAVEDRQLLDEVVSRSRVVPDHTTIAQEGENPTNVHLVLEGFACRSKYLQDGKRQIFAYLVPGDFCDLNVFILNAMDHNIETLSRCRMVEIPRQRILEMSARPQLARALWWATLVDEATLREWLVNLGQRSADVRLAHLFCEMHLRLKSVGLTKDHSCVLPITQIELGETMGMTAVHVNRMLQQLRAEGLIEFKGSMLTIPDIGKLREISGFNPNYLHLDGGKDDVRPGPDRLS